MKLFSKLSVVAVGCLVGLVASWPSTAKNVELPKNATDNLRILRDQVTDRRLQPDFGTALEPYEQALALAKKEFGSNSLYVAELYYEMGALAFEAAKFEQSECYLSEAVRANPNAVTARITLAELLERRNKNEAAIKQARAALQKKPNSVWGRQVLAISYLQDGNNAQSTKEFAYFDDVVHGRRTPAPKAVQRAPIPGQLWSPIKQTPTAQPAVKQPESVKQKNRREIKAALQTKAKAKLEAKSKTAAKQEGRTKPRAEPQWGTNSKSKAKPEPPLAHKAQSPPADALPQEEPNAKPATEPEQSPASKAKAPGAGATQPESKGKLTVSAEPTQAETAKSPTKPAPPPEPKGKAKTHKKPGGLVPPPPPVVPSFPPLVPPSGYQPGCQAPPYRPATKPSARTNEKPKEQASSASGVEKPASPPDEDFLLEWADKGGKKKK